MSSRRADVLFSAVVSSTGMGLPSAVDGASDAEEALGWNRGGKAKGIEWRRDLGARVDADVEAADLGGGGGGGQAAEDEG